jgi:hypothetical protein
MYSSIKRVTFIARRPTPRSASLLISLTHAYPNVAFHIGVADPAASDDKSASTSDLPSLSPAASTDTTPAPSDLAIDLSATVRAADIIITATSSTVPLFRGSDAKRGAHVILIGSYKPHMHEVDGTLLRRAGAGAGKEGAVLVDAREACAREAGELIAAGVDGAGMVELGEVLEDAAMAVEMKRKGELTVYKSVSGFDGGVPMWPGIGHICSMGPPSRRFLPPRLGSCHCQPWQSADL